MLTDEQRSGSTQKMPPEECATRKGGGGKDASSHIEGWRAIDLMNEISGRGRLGLRVRGEEEWRELLDDARQEQALARDALGAMPRDHRWLRADRGLRRRTRRRARPRRGDRVVARRKRPPTHSSAASRATGNRMGLALLRQGTAQRGSRAAAGEVAKRAGLIGCSANPERARDAGHGLRGGSSGRRTAPRSQEATGP